jgi:acyl-CoA hydrolase
MDLVIFFLLLCIMLYSGIGSIPDAVLASLGDHHELGVHSEMFSDGIIPLVEKGCITNSRKVLQPGKIVGSFAVGTRKLFDFMHNNPFVGKYHFEVQNNLKFISNDRRTDHTLPMQMMTRFK